MQVANHDTMLEQLRKDGLLGDPELTAKLEAAMDEAKLDDDEDWLGIPKPRTHQMIRVRVAQAVEVISR